MKQPFILLLLFGATMTFSQTEDELIELAKIEYVAENYKKAIKLYEQVIEKNPTNEFAYINLGYCNWYLDEYQSAFNFINIGLENNPNSALLMDTRGLFHKAIGKTEIALRDYRIALEYAKEFESDTIYYMILMNRSAAHSNRRDYQLAYDDLMLCYLFDSTNLGVINNIAVVCDEVGRGDETLGYLLRAIEVDSIFTPGYTNIGFHYQFRKEYEKSIPYFDKALELTPNEPLSLNNRGYSKFMIGDLKGALTDVNKSLEIYNANSYAYRNRALIYIEMDKMKKACEDLEEALRFGFSEMYGAEVYELQQKHCR